MSRTDKVIVCAVYAVVAGGYAIFVAALMRAAWGML